MIAGLPNIQGKPMNTTAPAWHTPSVRLSALEHRQIRHSCTSCRYPRLLWLWRM